MHHFLGAQGAPYEKDLPILPGVTIRRKQAHYKLLLQLDSAAHHRIRSSQISSRF